MYQKQALCYMITSNKQGTTDKEFSPKQAIFYIITNQIEGTLDLLKTNDCN